MDLHAVWSRIDQLERIVLSQAREIETLRRSLTSQQQRIDQVEQQQSHPRESNVFSDKQLTKSSYTLGYHPLPNSRSSIKYNKSSSPGELTTGRQQTNNNYDTSGHLDQKHLHLHQHQHKHQHHQLVGQSAYLMSSFVHPSSAIPPVSATVETGRQSAQCVRFAPNARWSTGASLGRLDGYQTNSELFAPTRQTLTISPVALDEDRPIIRERRNRQSLVELLTCFCPCFSMC